jgi:hypothetical protein
MRTLAPRPASSRPSVLGWLTLPRLRRFSQVFWLSLFHNRYKRKFGNSNARETGYTIDSAYGSVKRFFAGLGDNDGAGLLRRSRSAEFVDETLDAPGRASVDLPALRWSIVSIELQSAKKSTRDPLLTILAKD